MDNGMGGNGGVNENPFRSGAQNTTDVSSPQADGGAIVSTDETSNTDYAADFEQSLHQQTQGQSRKTILKVAAIVMGVLAATAIGFLLIKTQNFGANSANKQAISQTRSEVNTLLNLVINGEYEDEEVEVNDDMETLYIQRVIDSSENNTEKEKNSFFKNMKKSLKSIKKQLKENGENMNLKDLSYQKKNISGLQVMANVLETYAGSDYSDMNIFIDEYMENGKTGIEDKLADEMFSMTKPAIDKLMETEEGELFVAQLEGGNYRDMTDYVSSMNELMAFLYYMNLDYADKLSAMLDLYRENGCMLGGGLDEACRLRANNTEAGINTNKALIDTTSYIKDTMNDWGEGILYSLENLRDELVERDEQ